MTKTPTRFKWHRKWGGRYRDKYVAGLYSIQWVGSTHGVWQTFYAGTELGVKDLLRDAKQLATDHYDREALRGMARS